MILIISNDNEPTTDSVIDWLLHLKADFVRINSEDVVNKGLRLSKSINKDMLVIGDQEIDMNAVNVAWYRRWYSYNGIGIRPINAHQRQLFREMCSEAEEFLFYIYNILKDRKWLSNPLVNKTHSKLYAIHLAHRMGIKVPQSFITNQTPEVIGFVERHKDVITKPMGDPYVYFEPDGTNYKNFTQRLSAGFLKKLKPAIFTSLFQEMIKAECEIRTFYLDGEFYSTALVNSTTVDIKLSVKRDENLRMISYDLPECIKEKIRLLMHKLNLNTGSIDIIRDSKGGHYFLEVNPIGQFAGYGYASNYQLEKKVAEWLIINDVKKIAHNERNAIYERVC